MKSNLLQRLGFYLLGLFIMTIGVSLSVKSALGVSPISSIPYTMTVVWGIEMGKATILMHTAFVLIQILLLRRRFELRQLFQILVGVIFGYFTTFCNWLMTILPNPIGLFPQLTMSLLSIVLIATGIFFYLPANLIPLAGEGIMSAIATITGGKFSTVKIMTDCSMVLLSAITCLVLLGQLGSVGLGTIIAALLVGSVLKLWMHFAGKWRYHFNETIK